MRRTILVLLVATLWAQEPRFQSGVHEVVVPVSVTTKSGKPVENLSVSDFVLLNDGKPQRVRLISSDSDPLPVHAVIVVQTNDASEAALAKIRKTASVVSSYITNDMEIGIPSLTAVVSVSDDVRIVRDFTANSDALKRAFAKLSADGSSGRLLDGMIVACDLLAARKEPARRVIVLVGESRDRDSKTRFADVVAKAQKDNVVIYTLSFSAYTTAFTQKASDRPPPPDEPGLYNPGSLGRH